MPRSRSALFTCAALLIGGVAALSLAEIGLRLFWPQRSSVTLGMFQPDPHAGYSLRPNYANVIRVPEYTTAVRIDADGYRVAEAGAGPRAGAEAEMRVLAIGDSFTFGVGVEAEQSWPDALEGLLNPGRARTVTVRNGGVGGYGPLRSSLLLFSQQASWEPDILVHAIYLGNDLEDARPDSYLRAPRIHHGRMVAEESGRLMRTRYFLRIHSHLYAFLREQVYDLYQRTPWAERSRYLDPIGLARWPERIEQGSWPAAREAIREIAGWAEARGTEYLAVLIPVKYQVLDETWDRYCRRWGLPEEDFDRWGAQRVVAAFFEEKGIAHLDLLPALRGVRRAQECYYPFDVHWTSSGHRVAAAEIRRELRQRGWLDGAETGARSVAANPVPPAG